MPPRFGTDGVRGIANTELTPELALLLGRAAARTLGSRTFLVGRDTRESGPMLSAALSAGITSEGCDVVDVGVIPTPGLAYLASRRGLAAAMISASHNPYQDNGIKFFGLGGAKLSIATEDAVQAAMDELALREDGRTTVIGSIAADAGAAGEYGQWLAGVLPVVGPLPGEVVIDCANGAASAVGPQLFERLGLKVHVLSAAPNGRNINDGCGSTHLGPLATVVRERRAAFGIAFDGDADRMLAVDETGEVVDGDHLIALFAKDLRDAGHLPGPAVVVTVMSNLGLRLALQDSGIDIVETPVGDRHVADALESGGYLLGGEQSGHLIFREHAATGDGLLTAVMLIELVGRSRRSLGELAREAMTRLPQVLVNVPVADPSRLAGTASIWEVAEAAAAELGPTGRVLLRPSGTEACVRVMVEAPTHELAERHARAIVAAVEHALDRG